MYENRIDLEKMMPNPGRGNGPITPARLDMRKTTQKATPGSRVFGNKFLWKYNKNIFSPEKLTNPVKHVLPISKETYHKEEKPQK